MAANATHAAHERAVLEAGVVPAMMKLAAPTATVLIAPSLVGVVETWYVSFLGKDASLVLFAGVIGAAVLSGGVFRRPAPTDR